MSETLSKELVEWIRSQHAAGFSAVRLQESMRQAGYSSIQSAQALVAVLGTQACAALLGQKPDDMTREASPAQGTHGGASGTPPAASLRVRPSPGSLPDLPEPDLLGDPSVIRAHDVDVRVLVSIEHPRVVVFSGLLSEVECEALIADAQSRMQQSLTVDPQTGAAVSHAARVSEGMFFQREETPLIALLEKRIEALLHWPASRGEGLQILRYGVGGEYRPHHDYFDPSQPGTATHLERGGQRVGTLILYLHTPEAGGATSFPESGLKVAAQRGHAVFFSYGAPDPETLSLHAGDPVIRGVKWIATKWLRQGDFV